MLTGGTGVIVPMSPTERDEMGWCSDAIEPQLAHTERSKVRAAYRAEYLEERREMMQAWVDMVDGSANDDNKVTPSQRR